MTELDKTLEPCPFCGGEASLHDGGPGCFFVQCNLCNATSDDGSQDRAIARWNSRASTTSAGVTEEQVEALTFYAEQWEHDVDAERTATGWEGALGDVSPTPDLCADKGEKARRALAALEASRVSPVSQKEAVAKYPLATFGHADVLPLGIYRIHWKSGGSSLAAVGMMENGDRWLAPTNWTAPNMDPTNEWSWGDIDRAEPIPAPAPAVEQVGIKALEWNRVGVQSVAYALFGGSYSITEYAGMSKPYKMEKRGFDGSLANYWETRDEAKAAAQADYEARIRSALHTTPTPVSTPVGVVVDGEEDDNLIEGVAKAIGLHGIGRGWDDFEEVNAYDFDRGDLREYARAAIYASPLTDLLALHSPAVEGK